MNEPKLDANSPWNQGYRAFHAGDPPSHAPACPDVVKAAWLEGWDYTAGESASESMTREAIDIVFDGPPSRESGRFVEVENMAGQSISIGEWIDQGNGLWALRITEALNV